MQFFFKDLEPLSSYGFQKFCSHGNPFFDNPSTPHSATKNSMTWIKKSTDSKSIISNTNSSFYVVSSKVDQHFFQLKNKVILFSENPKLTFARICRKFFEQRKPPTIHQGSIVSKEGIARSGKYFG